MSRQTVEIKHKMSPGTSPGTSHSLGATALWQSVLLQAVQEANGGTKLRGAAISYLTTPSEGLRLVCDYAGMDYQVVLAGARKKWLPSPPSREHEHEEELREEAWRDRVEEREGDGPGVD